MRASAEGDKIYNVSDFPYDEIGNGDWILKKGKYMKVFYQYPAAFDIETTTIAGEEPYGYMYVWQFSLEKKVCMGRRWEEFQDFLYHLKQTMKLNDMRTLVIYVHYLSFEFQFLRSFVEFTDIFAKEPRKIMKADAYGFQFRCSYFLSNMSLEKFCENSSLCIHQKKSGEDFDYRIIRTPDTPLSPQELQYCVNDVLGLEECIDSMLIEDSIATIPMTSTGYVRRDAKKAMAANKKNRWNFIRTSLTLEQYQFVKKVFRGGDTHASRFFTDVHLYNMESYDIQSSYPAWMMTDYYPVGKLVPFTLNESVENYCRKYCCFMLIAFSGVEVHINEPHTYIDAAHCRRMRGITADNGRIKHADYIEYYCTEIDLRIINECYDYDGWTLMHGYYSERGQLPEELKNVIMDYYTAKTMLKGDVEKIYEYMKSKNKLNSTYGMMVSAILHDIITLENDEWKKTPDQTQEKLDAFYNNWSGFLPYQWGIYVTAHARERLHEGIRACTVEKGLSKAVYWDTDSVKFLSDPVIEERFRKINEMRMKEIECAEIPPVVVRDGKSYPMGIFEKEHHIEEFKTYGAKKYVVLEKHKKFTKEEEKRRYKDMLFTSTVAGMNKRKGAERMVEMAQGKNPIDASFRLGMLFHEVGRTVSYFNDDSTVKEITIEGCTFKTGADIGVVETTYKLGITGDYSALLSEDELKEIQKEALDYFQKGEKER